jgi:hypothetical protein
MGTASKASHLVGVGPGPYEETVQRIRELNERLIESSRAAGNTTLDAMRRP